MEVVIVIVCLMFAALMFKLGMSMPVKDNKDRIARAFITFLMVSGFILPILLAILGG